jgi:hypothetical protein
VHGADAEAVVAKRLEWQRAERGPLLGKHGGDLPLCRTVDAGVGPMGFPSRRLSRTITRTVPPS